MEQITLGFDAQGVDKVVRALNQISKEVRELQGIFRGISGAQKSAGKASRENAKEVEKTTKAYQSQTKMGQSIERVFKRIERAQRKGADAAGNYRDAQGKFRKSLKDAQRANEEYLKTAIRARIETTKGKRPLARLENSIQRVSKEVENASLTQSRWGRAALETAKKISNLRAQTEGTGKGADRYSKNVDRAKKSTDKFATSLGRASTASGLLDAKNRKGALGFLALLQAQAKFILSGTILFNVLNKIQAGLGRVVQESHALARVSVVLTNNTDNANKVLRTQRRLLTELVGLTINYGVSVSGAAEPLFQLGSAGFDVGRSLSAIIPIMNLAVGTGADLGETAKSVAGVFKVFGDGMKDVGSETEIFTKIVDVLGKAFNESLVETKDLTEGIKFVGNQAQATGVNFEQTVAILSVFNDNLLKGGLAGRSLRTILADLVNDNDKVVAAFGQGFKVGNFESLIDLLTIIRERLQSTNQELRQDTIAEIGTIFGRRGAAGILTLANQLDDLKIKLKDVSEGADGTAAAFANIKLGSLASQLDKLQQGFVSIVSSGLLPFSEGLNVVLTLFINPFLRAIVEFNQATLGVAAAVLALATAFGVWKVAIGTIIPKLEQLTIVQTFQSFIAGAEVGIRSFGAAISGTKGEVAALGQLVRGAGTSINDVGFALGSVLGPIAAVAAALAVIAVAWKVGSAIIDDYVEAQRRWLRSTDGSVETIRGEIDSLERLNVEIDAGIVTRDQALESLSNVNEERARSLGLLGASVGAIGDEIEVLIQQRQEFVQALEARRAFARLRVFKKDFKDQIEEITGSIQRFNQKVSDQRKFVDEVSGRVDHYRERVADLEAGIQKFQALPGGPASDAAIEKANNRLREQEVLLGKATLALEVLEQQQEDSAIAARELWRQSGLSLGQFLNSFPSVAKAFEGLTKEQIAVKLGAEDLEETHADLVKRNNILVASVDLLRSRFEDLGEAQREAAEASNEIALSDALFAIDDSEIDLKLEGLKNKFKELENIGPFSFEIFDDALIAEEVNKLRKPVEEEIALLKRNVEATAPLQDAIVPEELRQAVIEDTKALVNDLNEVLLDTNPITNRIKTELRLRLEGNQQLKQLAEKSAEDLSRIADLESVARIEAAEQAEQEINKIAVERAKTRAEGDIGFSILDRQTLQNDLRDIQNAIDQVEAETIKSKQNIYKETKKLEELEKQQQKDAIRSNLELRNVQKDTILQIKALKREQLDDEEALLDVQSLLRKEIGEAQSLALDPRQLEGSEAALQRAKSLLSEIPKEAIEQNGEIIVSEEELRDIRISALKKIGLAQEEIARTRRRQQETEREGELTASQERLNNAKKTVDELIDLDDRLRAKRLETQVKIAEGTQKAEEQAREQLQKTLSLFDSTNFATFKQSLQEFSQAFVGVAEVTGRIFGDELLDNSKSIRDNTSEIINVAEKFRSAGPVYLFDLFDPNTANRREVLDFLATFGVNELGDLPRNRYGGPVGGGYGGGDRRLILGEDGEYMFNKEARRYYGDNTMHALNNRLIDRNLLNNQPDKANGDNIYINITPDAASQLKGMTEEDVSKLTLRIAKNVLRKKALVEGKK